MSDNLKRYRTTLQQTQFEGLVEGKIIRIKLDRPDADPIEVDIALADIGYLNMIHIIEQLEKKL